ncbi:Hypothetical predicted protein [Paramuricea clavata]|uniref:Uncharacterized protein n=1 Tax=Paramuricea clavata TaxID=317549 RepID=A0A6S7K0J1_PARCT|nr:Hypothetical predicted protein [Paramuricea clavata]
MHVFSRANGRYAKTSSNFEDDHMKKGIDEKAETIFYLYTNTSVKSASIKRCDEDKTTKMTKTKFPKDEIGYLWEARISSTSTADIQYYYTLERKYNSSTLSDNTLRCTEPRSTNYDSFHEKNYSCPFSERATICYSKWFFETVNELQNFDAYLTAIKRMNFNFQQLDSKVLKTFVSWIFEQETKDNIPKCLYLGALLALVDKNNAFDWQRKSDEHLCKRFADHFLDVLRTQEAIFLLNDRKTLVNSLIRLAPKLVNASSFPRWISYVTSFYPYFGVKQILSESFTFKKGPEYSQEKYVELVDWLTQHMTRDHAKDLQEKFLQILERILFEAPDMDAVVSLYNNSAFLNLFLKGKEQTEVFGKVFIKKAKDILIDNKGRLSKALTEIPKIPDKLQKQSIKAILLDFIELPSSDSSDRDKENNSSDFCNEMSRENRLSLGEITSVIHALVTSNQLHCHGIFLHLLTSNFYEMWWEKLGKDQHVSILSKWIAVDLADHPSKALQCQPRDVFERAAELERLNIFSVGLIEEACFKGFERKNKDANNFTLASMLEALATIEGLSQPLQECYKKLFGSMLKKSSAVKEDIIYCSKKKSWCTDIPQKISRWALIFNHEH